MAIKRYKPKYIRKYDYLRSFYMPKDEWFLSTIDLNKCLELRAKDKNILFDDEDDDFFGDKEIEVDNYSTYKEYAEDHEDVDTIEDLDPRIFEGKIIDSESKKFIKDTYQLPAQDLSRLEIGNKDKAFEITKKYLNEKNIILFQPTFIFNGMVTKPDAIVIKDGKATLIEVKGTSNPKTVHLFDLYFQFNIVDQTIKLDSCLLCLVKYELKKTRQVSFVLVPRGSFSKSGFSVKGVTKEDNPFDPEVIEKKAAARECRVEGNQYNNEIFNFINIFINNPFTDEFIQQNIKNPANGVYLAKDEARIDAFNKRVQKLKDFVIEDESIIPLFVPCPEYKSDLKDAEHWTQVRDMWFNSNQNYGTQFSGKLISYQDGLHLNSLEFNNLDDFIWRCCDFIDKPMTSLKLYIEFLELAKNSVFAYDIKGVAAFMKENLDNKKKVYFDFESLNTAIRVIDDYPPFMQTVNQVSVVYDLDGDEDITEAEPIVIDPLNGITKQDFKMIVDRILPPCKKESFEDKKKYWSQFKYIVYNKGFEDVRLKEMMFYINEQEYYEKILIIKQNMVDLADLFTIVRPKGAPKFLVFKELKGFYSIKKVLPLVEKYDHDAFTRAGCVSYKIDLNVHNGTQAQSLSTRRFFNKIDSDEDWEKNVIDLKKYCNNDVRAMVAVEYFVRDLIDNKLDFSNYKKPIKPENLKN